MKQVYIYRYMYRYIYIGMYIGIDIVLLYPRFMFIVRYRSTQFHVVLICAALVRTVVYHLQNVIQCYAIVYSSHIIRCVCVYCGHNYTQFSLSFRIVVHRVYRVRIYGFRVLVLCSCIHVLYSFIECFMVLYMCIQLYIQVLYIVTENYV